MSKDSSPRWSPLAAAQLAHAVWLAHGASTSRIHTRGLFQSLMAGRPDWDLCRRQEPLAPGAAQPLPPESLPLGERLRHLDAAGRLVSWLPADQGGLGDRLDQAFLRLERIAATDLALATAVAAHAFAVVPALVAARPAALRPLPAGKIAALAVSEAQSGSDAALMETTLKRGANGLRLNGEKSRVLGGAAADYFLVLARGPEETAGLTAALVPADRAGLTRTPRGANGLAGAGLVSLAFREVEVVEGEIVGVPGGGYLALLTALTHLRLAIAHVLRAALLPLLPLAHEALAGRKQFGKPLFENAVVQETLAALATDEYRLAAVIELTDRLAVNGADVAAEAALCRREAAAAAERIVAGVRKIEGAAGCGNARLAALAEDLRCLSFCGGVDEVLELFLALHGSRPVLQRSIDLDKAKQRLFARLDAAVAAWWRGLSLAFIRPRFPAFPAPLRQTANCCREMTRVLAERTWQVCRYYGNAAIEHPYDLARLGRLATDTYALLACLLRASSVLEGNAAGDQTLARLVPPWHALRAWARFAATSRELYLSDESVAEEIAKRIAGEA